MKKTVCLLIMLVLINTVVFAAPSSWAIDAVFEAEDRDIIPDGMGKDWQKAITREEFCEALIKSMAYNLEYNEDEFFEYAEGVEYRVVMGEDSTERFYFSTVKKDGVIEFEDCDNPYVLLAADMGIVNGRKENIFAPDENITRQEAAVMLTRVTNLCSSTVGYSTVKWADYDSVAPWAKQAVQHMRSSSVMTGVGHDRFEPHSLYTREQAIVTLIRQSEQAYWKDGHGKYKVHPSMERALAEIENSPIMSIEEKTETDYGVIVLVKKGGAMHVGGYGLYFVTDEGETIDLYENAPAYNNLGYKPKYDSLEIDGRNCTFTFTFDDKLEQMNMAGAEMIVYHEKGTYVFDVDLRYGDVTYEIVE